MPRFSVAFSKRKSTADEFENVDITAAPPQSSFRVLERNQPANGSAFAGGARMAMAKSSTTNALLRPTPLDTADDNIFSDFKTSRGSGISNTTHATSAADDSSRHSNASTAPSSTDMAGGSSPVETRNAAKAAPGEGHNVPDRGPSTKSVSASLFKAPRTWSFGGQKKQSVPPPNEEPPVPDLPPVLTLQTGGAPVPAKRPSPTSPDHAAGSEQKTAFDMGGDFGAMFSGMEKRESLSTVREGGAAPRALTGGRGPLSPVSPNGGYLDSARTLHGSSPDEGIDRQSSVQRQISEYKKSTPSPVEDEDANLLRDSFTAMKFLDHDPSETATESFYGSRYRRDDEPISRKPIASKSIASNFEKEDNLFEGSVSRYSRTSHRYIPRTTYAPRNKVMTPAQFERYKQDKEKQGMTQKTTGRVPPAAAKQQQQQQQEEEEDDINYDDEEDEAEKSRQQTKQRRKQEAHMAVYRQQMMKVTGEHANPSFAPQRPGLPTTHSAPLLSAAKAPSPKVPSEEDDDEEVPLAILQAHGFPNKNRGPSRASMGPSTTNLTPSSQPGGRDMSSGQSSAGDFSTKRASTLPAFARSLPQDPFVGASVAKPALRESMSFHENPQGSLPPGGLVGVIANEERSRAMRRGSPNMDAGRFQSSNHSNHHLPNQGFDPAAGIPQHMMYSQGGASQSMQGLPQMPQQGMPPHMMQGMPQPPMMSPGDQAQAQMNHQMQQFMQMQMQFMQMQMAMNQNGQGPYPNQPPGGMPASQSMNDLSSRQSMMGGEPMPDRMDRSMRTMSMMQPPSMPMAPMANPGYAGSMRGSVAPAGYAPSIAPSERSNVGLPGRYRAVSQATPSPRPSHSERLSAMSGALGGSDGSKSRSSLNVSKKSPSGSDDDDEEGWEAMKAKREKKRHIWRRKKDLGSELTAN